MSARHRSRSSLPILVALAAVACAAEADPSDAGTTGDSTPSASASAGASASATDGGPDDATLTATGSSDDPTGTADATTDPTADPTADPTGDTGSVEVGDCMNPSHPYNANEQALVDLPADTWWTAPNTSFAPVCEAVQRPWQVAVEGCRSVIHSWSGGVWTGTQLLVWGGGHTAYYGNEVYGFDVASLSWSALTEPTQEMSFDEDPMADGQPVSRHTYDQLAFIAHRGEMMGYGGAIATNGGLSWRTWLFDVASATWRAGDDGGRLPEVGAGSYWGATAYDAESQRVYIQDAGGVRVYDPEAMAWETLSDVGYAGYKRAVIVPDRRLFLVIGDIYDSAERRVLALDLDTHADVSDQWSALVDTLPFDGQAPGLDVDLSTGTLVGWSGGAPHEFDLDTQTWSALSGAGAPAAQTQYGTYGRFRYLPQYNVFLLVNDGDADAVFYKHTAACG